MSLKNLEKIAKTVEKYMLDEVVIMRLGLDSATVDPVTLEMTAPEECVYDGKAMIVPQGQPAQTTHGGEAVASTGFEIGIPRGSVMMIPNDVVTVINSVNNPDMIDMVLYVVGEIESTFFTHRRMICTRKESAE